MTRPEVIDIFDETGEIIGSVPREEAERDNHTIQNVIVFVFNALGKVWIQKRSKHKNHFPGLWDVSACGAIRSGENPREAAEREQLEEMGFSSELHLVETFINKFIGHDGQPTERLSHLFIGMSEESPVTNDEVDEFLAIPHAELRERVVKEPTRYIPSFLIELDKTTKAIEEI